MFRFVGIPFLLFFLLSCGGNSANNNVNRPNRGGVTAPEPAPEPAPVIRRVIPKKSDPAKQEQCKKVSKGNCGDDKKCEDICDDVFKGIKLRRKCEALPEALVVGFEDLLDQVEDGDIQEVNLDHLECLLDIDETGFAKSVKELSRREVKDFLSFVAESEDLARILEDEDEEYVILKQLLNKISGSNQLKRQLTADIEDRKGLLWLSSELSEEYVWDWMDGYVDEEFCDKGKSECPGEENIGAYCSILLDTKYFNKKKLEEFLGDADIFANEYEDEVKEEDYLYEVDDDPDDRYEGDFRDWCRTKTPVPCPADGTEPESSKRLATITFDSFSESGTDHRLKYRKSNYCESGATTTLSAFGTSAPENQNTLLRLNGYRQLVLNKDEIENYDASDNTYYLYIGSKRLDLNSATATPHREDSACPGDPKNLLTFSGGDLVELHDVNVLKYSTTPTAAQKNRDIYLASEKDEACTYYQ